MRDKELDGDRAKIILEILGVVSETFKNSPTAEECSVAERRNDRLLRQFIRGGSLKKFNDAKDVPIPGVVKILDFDMLEEVLFCLKLPEDEIEGIINHEKAHFDEAEKAGFSPRIIICISRHKNGKKYFLPSIVLELPNEGDEEVARQAIKKILVAPEDPSTSDHYKLHWFNSKK